MHSKVLMSAALAVVAALGIGSVAGAAGPAPYKISASGMHCGGCAAKVAAKLKAIPQVANVQTDFPTATFTLAPQPQTAPSPRAVWEAVEKAGYKPTRLVTPLGTFTAKPKA